MNKSKTSAFLLALFLGGWGAHRFYVGKKKSAITMLILAFSIIGAPIAGIWALIDCIGILTGSFKDNNGCDLV